jgi:uncharacterized protein YbjT (DUF2867 family)
MILVTGGSGYIGSHIVRKLAGAGRPVKVMVHNRLRAEEEGRLSGLEVQWVEGDVTKPETLQKAFEGITVVVHTVAIAIEKGGRTYETINYQGTVNVVEACKAAGVRRLISMSQMGAQSSLPYRFLASKGKAQEYVAASGLDWTAFRPTVVWGPEDEFANTFAKLAKITPLIYPIVDKKARFQPVWVEDLATAVVKAIDDPLTIGKEYELGGPEILTLEEIERRALQAVGAKRAFIPFPRPMLTFIVAVMEALLPNPPVTRNLLELLAVDNIPTKNETQHFVAEPRPFTPENAAPYMQEFTAAKTLKQLFGKT